MRTAIADLKKKVLTLAVSGQLVPQDPRDGTSEDLYRAIQTARAHAAKTVKARKKTAKPLLPISIEETTIFPSEWRTVRLGEVCEFAYGKGLDKQDRPPNGEYPAYGANGMLSRSTKFNCEGGGIIIGRKGSAGAITKVSESFYALDVTYYVPKDQFGAFDFDYLYFLLVSLNLPALAGGVKPGLNRENAYKLIIGLPPLTEQCRIVAKLEEVMYTIDTLESECNSIEDLLSQLEKRILTLAVSGQLVPQDSSEGTADELYATIQNDRAEKAKTATGRKKTNKPLPPITPKEIPFNIPQSWKWVRLEGLLQVENGFAFKSSDYVDDGARVIRITNVQDGEIVDRDPKFMPIESIQQHKDYEIYEGDLLMSLTGNVGRVGLFPEEMLPALLNQRVARLVPFDSAALQFLFLFLRSQVFVELAKGGSRGMAQANMSTEWLKTCPLPLAPLAEQRRIVAKVDEAMSLIKHFREAIS